jgi:hypothetical protein
MNDWVDDLKSRRFRKQNRASCDRHPTVFALIDSLSDFIDLTQSSSTIYQEKSGSCGFDKPSTSPTLTPETHSEAENERCQTAALKLSDEPLPQRRLRQAAKMPN